VRKHKGRSHHTLATVAATVMAIAASVLLAASAAGAATSGPATIGAATGLASGPPTGQTATPAAGSSAGNGVRNMVYLQVTSNAAKTMPGGATPAKRMTPSQSGPVSPNAVRPDAAIPTPVEPITPDQCLQQRSAFSGNGYAAGRFDSCQAHHLHAWHVECSFLFGCDVVGTADADLTDIQFTDDGDREIFVTQTIGNWHVVGDMNEISLTADATCSAAAGSGPCNTLFGVPTTQLIDEWALEGTSTNFYSFEQPNTSGTGTDLLSHANLSWHLTVTGGENGPVTRDGPNSAVRCDAASYLIHSGSGNGCVFSWAPIQTWVIHRSSTPQSAQNIFLAQTNPGATQPPSAFKFIAGTPATGPLRRTANATLIDSHRNTAQAACRRYFRGRYPSPGIQCDEYPFASTLQGAVNIELLPNFIIRNYAVEPINGTDNETAGRQLNRFYAAQRILGSSRINDPFYVSVQP
jgi:hypothetical protein